MAVGDNKEERSLWCGYSKGMGAHTVVITELKLYTLCLSVSAAVTVITQSPPLMQRGSATKPWRLTTRLTQLHDAKYKLNEINRWKFGVRCKNNLRSPRYRKFNWTQLLVGGCHPELRTVLNALHGSCLWAPHHQGHCRVRGMMDGPGCSTMANVTSCQPLNRGAVSGGCRQPVCQSDPL